MLSIKLVKERAYTPRFNFMFQHFSILYANNNAIIWKSGCAISGICERNKTVTKALRKVRSFIILEGRVCNNRIFIYKIKECITDILTPSVRFIYIYIYIYILESHLSRTMWKILYQHINAFICCSVLEQQIGVALRGYSMLCDSL